MVVVMVVMVIFTYILILLGLTIWFEKYHYYKNHFFNKTIPKEETKPDSTSSKPKPQSIHHP